MKNPWVIAAMVGTVFAVSAAAVFAADGRLFTGPTLLVVVVAYALPLFRTAAQQGGLRLGRRLREHRSG